MKIILVISLSTAFIYLEAMHKSPKKHAPPTSAAAGKVSKETVPLVIPAFIVQKLAQQSAHKLLENRLAPIVFNKIAQSYPKWPLELLPDLVAREITYQREHYQSQHTEQQDITLSLITRFKLDSFHSTLPIINSRNRIRSQLKLKYPLLTAHELEKPLTEILQLAVKQKMDTVYQDLYKTARPAACTQQDYATILGIHTRMSSLKGPQDILLLSDTVDIVLEEAPPTIQAESIPKSSACSWSNCIIS